MYQESSVKVFYGIILTPDELDIITRGQISGAYNEYPKDYMDGVLKESGLEELLWFDHTNEEYDDEKIIGFLYARSSLIHNNSVNSRGDLVSKQFLTVEDMNIPPAELKALTQFQKRYKLAKQAPRMIILNTTY